MKNQMTDSTLADKLNASEQEINAAHEFCRELCRKAYEGEVTDKLQVTELIHTSNFQPRVKIWMTYNLAQAFAICGQLEII